MFTPSINITKTDVESFNYIVTKNSESVVDSIVKNFFAGFNIYSIIGSYGTGKSSFLIAFEKSLKGEKIYFDSIHSLKTKFKNIEVIKIVGEYSPFPTVLYDKINSRFNCTFNSIEELVSFMKSNKETLYVILVDEFGKFLEFASNANPKRDIYFFQELAETIYDPNPNILLLFTLHQNFDAYSSHLEEEIKHEWQKVKGRFKEIAFNESVDRLVYFLSKRASTKYNCDLSLDKLLDIKKFLSDAKFLDQEEYDIEFIKNIYPFEPLTVKVLVLVLQTYGQNERSIFSFLNSEDIYSLNYYKNISKRFYSLIDIYDYLFHNFHSVIFSRNNPHYLQWGAIRNSIERAQNTFDNHLNIETDIIKLIGLLNIFYVEKGIINKAFITNYLLHIKEYPQVEIANAINELEKKKIIRFVNYKNKFVLFEGTDIDIEYELMNATSHVDYGKDILKKINRIVNKKLFVAKKHFVITGAPRFFEFIITEELIKQYGFEKDGFINLIFNENIDIEDLLRDSANLDLPGIYCYFKDLKKIKDLIFQHDKARYVLNNVADDAVAAKEIKNYINHLDKTLDEHINFSFYTDSVIWFYNGKLINIKNQQQLNQTLSEICDNYYYLTPIIKNELINKNNVSTAISNVWNNFVKHLILNFYKKDLGFDDNKFPPEKFIYLTLLKYTGIHKIEGITYTLSAPSENLIDLWKACEDFLEITKLKKRTVAELYCVLKNKPFGLKNGIIDFWIPIFLFANRNNFALYGENGFISEITFEIFKLIKRIPNKYSIKAFSVDGIKLDLFNIYRQIIQQNTLDKAGKQEILGTLEPFLLFYNSLSDYAKYTKNISLSAQNFRNTLVNSTDLEKLLFEDIPYILGYDYKLFQEDKGALTRFSNHLLSLIKEIRASYDELLNKVENIVLDTLGYTGMAYIDYKCQIEKKFSALSKDMLTPEQKLFLDRLLISMESRERWLNALGYPIIGKNVDQLRDDEEAFFLRKLKSFLKTLNTYVDFEVKKIDDNKQIFKIEIIGYQDNLESYYISIDKNDIEKAKNIESTIQNTLKNENPDVINYILLKMLKDNNHG